MSYLLEGFNMNEYEIIYDDSGESERYGEPNWFISDQLGNVLHDLSFETEQEAREYLESCDKEDLV